jgi:hypothetical protein
MKTDPKKKKSPSPTAHNTHVGRIGANTMKEDRKVAKGTGNSFMSGGPPPRVGGTMKSSGMAQGTMKKASIKKAIKNIKKTNASPQAKKAAKRAYKRY